MFLNRNFLKTHSQTIHFVQFCLRSEREREREKPAANTYIEAADDVVFFFRESTMLDVGPQVI
jgi:hypothetical protein